jgi:hypothetical protein
VYICHIELSILSHIVLAREMNSTPADNHH